MSDHDLPPNQPSLFSCLEPFEDPPPPNPISSWSPLQTAHFHSSLSTDNSYIIDPFAFTRQKEVNHRMRALLLDWIMEVCSEFCLRRETFYLTISHIDRLFSIINIRSNELQLVGISCLYIACKTEESKVPKLTDFVRIAMNVHPARRIVQTELHIVKTLKWKIYPQTHYSVLNSVLTEWDFYIRIQFQEYSDYVAGICRDVVRQHEYLCRRLHTFKQENTYSHNRFREITQVLDATMMDFSVYRYQTCRVIASLVYLMVNRCFFMDNYEILWWNVLVNGENIEISKEELWEIGNEAVHAILVKFLFRIFNIESIESLIDPISYLQQFLSIDFSYATASVARVNPNIQEHYENYLSYQIYNPNIKPFFQQRLWK
jgi:hypothetical protein